MRRPQRFTVLLLLLCSDCSATTTLSFPEAGVGQIATRPASTAAFGYDLDTPGSWQGWETLGPAAGQVEIPDGHVVRLTVSNDGARDTRWVSALPADSIAMLIASRTELDDEGFEGLSELTGLRHLDVGSTSVTSAIRESLSRLRQLQYLWLSYVTTVDDDLMPAVAALPELEQVGVWTTAITDAGLAALAESKSLRAVYAGRTKITDAGVAALTKMPTLRAVRLNAEPEEFRREGENHPRLTDAVVDALCARPELELLDLSAARLSDEGLGRLAGKLKQLRRLVIDHTPVTRQGLLQLAGFERLESLRCYDLEGDGARFDDEVADRLSGMKHLKALRVDMELTDWGASALAQIPTLESLRLSGAGVTDATMPMVAAMPALEELTIEHTRVTPAGFEAFRGSPTLRRIQLTGHRITTRCVETLATMPRLARVGLMSTSPRADGQPVWKGIEGLAGLEEELWLFDCPSLSPAAIASVATFDRVKNLRIDGGRPLSDEEVEALAACRSVELLELTSTLAADRGLKAISDLPRLRSLTLSCAATDAGLMHFAESASLSYATIASPEMTDAGFDALRAANPRLDSLRRGEFRLANRVVSRSKSAADPYWRLGDQDDREVLNAMEGELAPPIAATRWINTDEDLTWDALDGKVVLVDFWGSWCGPCIAQLPEVRRLRDKFADRGLVVIGVHSTRGSGEGWLYAESEGLDWPIALDDANQTKTAYNVPGWPSLYLIDRGGVVRFARPFPGDLETAIESLLTE